MKNFPFFVDINKSTITDSETIIARIFKLVEIDWYLQAVNNCLDEFWLKQANSSRVIKLKQRDTRRENTMYLKNLNLDSTYNQYNSVLAADTFTLPFHDLDT